MVPDLVLFNTCGVRDHAEQKVLSKLGAVRKSKERNRDMIVGVIGCMAERDPDGIFAKMPHVDLVCGPGELNKIPAMLAEVEQTRARAIALSQSQSRKSTPLQRSPCRSQCREKARPVSDRSSRTPSRRSISRAIRRRTQTCCNPTSACSTAATSSARFASCRLPVDRSEAARRRRSLTRRRCWSTEVHGRSR